MNQIFELIKNRRSVRTFDGRVLTTEDRTKLLDFIEQIENPYEIPVHFRILNAAEHRLSSNVLSGAVNYIAAKVRHVPHAEEAFGYSFEMLVLFAQSLGIGTTWIGGTMDRSAFETAMQLENGEIMPCASPLGYPAKKMSLRETLMRKGVRADSRLPFEDLFFADTFGRPLTPEEAGSLVRPLEAVRLAPSAVNRQPWHVVKIDNALHFYKKISRGFISPSTGDLQKIDLGIALCHFALTAKEEGLDYRFEISDPGIPVPNDTEYIASFILS